MNITYFIIAHSNLKHLKRLIDALNNENTNFVIHIDKKCSEDFSFMYEYKNVKLIEPRIDVAWGGFSIIETILEGLKEVVKNKTDFVFLLSGTDYPLKSNEYIINFLYENKEKDFIEGFLFPSPDCHWLEGGRRRLECYALDLGNKNIATIEPRKLDKGNIRQLGKVLIKSPLKLLNAINILFNYNKRRHPENLVPYRGEMWWGLRKQTAEKILKYIDDNPTYLHYHKHTCIPDEIFISTLVYNLIPKSQITNSSLRFINWGQGVPGNSPNEIIFSDFDFNNIENSNYLFGRKITDNTTIDLINKYIKSK